MNVLELIRLVRPWQWVKNGFVALPMFFGGEMLNGYCWSQTIITFLAFSLISSSIYCLNDIKDVNADRKHPKKRLRPIASGKVSVGQAYMVLGLLIIGSLGCCSLLGGAAAGVAGVIMIYLCLNIAYCLRLKRYAIIDVFILSMGFVLRLVAGGVACDIWLSPWIVSMTFLLSLFLAFAKRRDDVVLHEETGVITRSNIIRYNLTYMNEVLGLIGAVTMVCYIIYTVTPEVEFRLGSEYVYVSSIFVLAGILRYLQVSIVDTSSGSPTKILLKDRFIQACIVLWIMVFVIILYL